MNKIYLNNFNIAHDNSSIWKSSGKLMSFYFIIVFILFQFYARMGFYIQSLQYIYTILLYLCIQELLPGIYITQTFLILST